MNIFKLILTLNFVFNFLPPFVNADQGGNSLFSHSSEYISNFYITYSSIIDLLIYTLLFVGISQATLGRHFPSRGGKAVSVALGLALAIGLVTSEKALGFNLRTFGPIAAGILILLVGIMIFNGLKKAGITSISATASTFLITYLIIILIFPDFAQWIANNPYTSWIHLFVIIAIAILIYKLFKSLIPDKKKSLQQRLKKLLEDKSPKNPDLQAQIEQLKGEKDFIKKEMEKKSIEAAQNSKDIIHELSSLKNKMKELSTPQGRYTIVSELQSLPLQEQRVTNTLLPIKEKVKQLARFDYRHFQQLKNDYPKLPSNERKLIKREIHEEWKKLDAENKIIKLGNTGESYNRNFIQVIQALMLALKENRVQSALVLIDEALKWEEKIWRIFKQIRHLEHKLKSYTNHERRLEGKQLKRIQQAKMPKV